MEAIVAFEISGANQRRNGPMKREVCSADIKSVEPIKMKAIQSRTGSQYLMNNRVCIARWKHCGGATRLQSGCAREL
jgi:hypothetical protein